MEKWFVRTHWEIYALAVIGFITPCIIAIYAFFKGGFWDALASFALVAMGQTAVALLFLHDVEDD